MLAASNGDNTVFFSAQGREGVQKIHGERGFATEALCGAGMNEAQPPGMEHLARGSETGELGQTLVLTISIGGIAGQRKAQELEVDTDLVGAPGVEHRLGQ